MPTIDGEDRRLARLERYIDERYRDIAVRVRVQQTGLLGPVYGGRWDLFERRYCEPWEIRYHELSARTPELAEQAALRVHELELSAKQADFAEDFAAPMLMVNGSRRAGKSMGSAAKCMLHVARFPGVPGEMISPTFPKARIMWRYIRRMIPVEWIEQTLRAEMVLEFFNEVRLPFLSAFKPDSLVGEGTGWIGFDEFQNIAEHAFALALPALSDGGSAFQAWGTGTPRMGDYRRRYERFRALEASGAARVLRFTYRDNPYIYTGEGSIFDLAHSLIDPRKRQQELEALFVAEEGLVYYRFDRGLHARPWDEPGRRLWAEDITESFCSKELQVDARYVIGVDYGINRQYATIFKVVRAHGKLCLWVIGELALEKDADVQTLGEQLLEREWYPAAVMDDCSGPRSRGGKRAAVRLENMRDRQGRQTFHIFHYSKNPRVQDRIDSVNALMYQGRWYIDAEACPHYVHCLENHEIERGRPRRDKRDERPLRPMNDAGGYPVVYLFPAEIEYEAAEEHAA